MSQAFSKNHAGRVGWPGSSLASVRQFRRPARSLGSFLLFLERARGWQVLGRDGIEAQQSTAGSVYALRLKRQRSDNVHVEN